MTIVEFLNARYDEAEARHQQDVTPGYLAFLNGGIDRTAADIAAKRAILALHAHYVEQKREGAKYSDTWQPDEGCQTCHWDNDCNCIEDSGYPCDTVKLLASAYAEHPDYRPEWRL